MAGMSIPEVACSGLTKARAAYEHAGALIVRDAIHLKDLGAARDQWLAAFRAFDEMSESPEAHDAFKLELGMFSNYQFIQQGVLRHRLNLPDGLASHLGRLGRSLFGRVSYVEGKSAIRRQGRKSSAYVVWHRDAHAVQTMESGDCFNCWVPSESVGEERSSLQIAVGSNRDWKNRPVNYERHDNPAHEDVEKNYEIATAVLNPGDILIFSHFTLHRTQPIANEIERISSEFRFAIKPSFWKWL
jgi:hypothetical protein